MIQKEIKTLINSDLYRYYGNTSFKYFIKAIIGEPGFRYTYFLRKSSFVKRKGLFYLVNRIFLRKYMFKFGFQIHRNTKIGKGFYIGHFGNVIINPKSVIGNNVNIAQGVTLGRINFGKKEGSPIIGNKVWIGPNAIIVGKIKVGDNVLVAPGAFVNFDVPANSMVIGNPGKIYEGKTSEGYVNRIVE